MQDENWKIAKLLEEKYSGEKAGNFFADRTRLERGEPLAYVIGTVPFLDCIIHLDSHPLIPRPETEYWVEKAIQHIRESKLERPYVLDLCAGSGCIGVAVLCAIPDARVDFVEIDAHHHDTIQKNIETNDIDSRKTHIIGGSLFENVSGTYDFILSNPPYVDPALDRVETSVRAHEPGRALYGGTGGTELINAIIQKAPQHLTLNGALYLEHEPEQSDHIMKIAKEHGFSVRVHTDQYGTKRYTQLTQTGT